jgi:iron complex outermembrane receptor protein
VAAPALADDDSTKAPDPNAPAHAGTERVEVTGKGAVVPPTSFVTVIRPSERLGAVAGLADLLSSSVGVRVRSYGGLNSFATVSIRGSTSEQVVVLIDGVPVNSPLGGGFDLSEIPLTGVDSIEVHRGFTPATLGSASIGGAVNIRTRTPEAGSSLQGSLACGSFGTTEATALGSVATGPMRWVLSGSVFTSRGDFTYLDNNATPLTTADDTFTTRGNNESRAGSFRATGRLPFGEGGAFTLAAEWLGRRRGVPGIDAFQSESASLGKTRALLRSDLSREGLAGGSLDLSAGLDGEYTSESFEDTDDPLTAFPVDTTTRIQGTGARFALTARPSTRQRITVLLQPRVDSVTVIDRIGVTSEPVKARRTMLSAVAENEIRFASGRFLLAPSLRYDAVATSSSGGGPNVVTEPAEDPADYSGRLGALWILTPRLSLRGNVGRYFRIPSLLELYGNEGTLVGNPVLTPERGTNADLGFTWTAPDAGPFARTLVEISAFRSATDDLIHMRTLATRQVKAFNTGAARITGIEASFSTRFLGRLDLSGNATLQHPEDRSDTFNQGHDLSGIPRQEASTAEALDLGSLWLFHRLNYIGENTIDALGSAASSLPPSRQEQLRLPARYLHDAGIRLKLGDRAFLTAEVLNLFDRHVVDVARYPLPGRTLLVRVEGSF